MKNYELYRKYAIPSTIKYVLQSMVENADRIVAIIFINITALAVVNLIMPFLLGFIGLLVMFISGTGVQINYLIGRGEKARAERLFSAILVIITLLAIVICIFLLAYKEQVFRLASLPASMLPLAQRYYPFIIYSFVGLTIGYGLDIAIIADRNPKYSAFLMLSGTLSNLLLNIVFVVFLNMGVYGLGLATLFSSIVMAAVGIGYFLFRLNRTFCLRFPAIRFREFSGIVYNGSSELFTMGGEAINIFVLNTAILRLLTARHLEAYSVVGLFLPVLVSVAYGGVMGVSPLISEFLGQNEIERGEKLFHYTAKITLCIGLGFYLLGFPIIYGIGLLLEKREYLLQIYSFAGLGQVLAVFTFGITLYFTAIKRPLESILSGCIPTALLLPLLTVLSIMLFGGGGIGLGFLVGELLLIPILFYYKRYTLQKAKKGKGLEGGEK